MSHVPHDSSKFDQLRARAEAEILKRTASPEASLGEIGELVHELQTHQIELEMQNEELRRAQDELVESRDELAGLYDFAPVGYVTISQRGIIAKANLTFADLVGEPRVAIVGRPLSSFVAEEDQDLYFHYLRRLLQDSNNPSCELRMFQEGGTPFSCRLNGTVVEMVSDDDSQICLTITDISDHMRMEESLRQSQKMDAIGRLAAGVAHEFNNMLVGILGNAEALLATPADELPKDFERPLKAIKRSGQRCSTLTKQLLSFASKKISKVEPFDLNELIVTVESMLRRAVGSHFLFDTVLEIDLPQVRTDSGEVEQVLVNLVMNARDAMPEGGTLTIRTSVVSLTQSQVAKYPPASPGRYVRLTVADKGCGMSAATARRAFEPFFTTKHLGKGTGLGLSTVYADVTKCGGFIEVESRLDEGSAFYIHLPIAEDVVPDQRQDDDRLAIDRPGGTETILVCDDEEIVLDSIAVLLKIQGYTVLQAKGASEALEIAKSHAGTIALLMTDVCMPETNGWELATEFANMYPTTKVIFMSGYANDVLNQGSDRAKHIEFLQKPCVNEVLFRKIREVLNAS